KRVVGARKHLQRPRDVEELRARESQHQNGVGGGHGGHSPSIPAPWPKGQSSVIFGQYPSCQRDVHLGFSHRHWLRNLASAIDEKLRNGADRTVFQRDDPNWTGRW